MSSPLFSSLKLFILKTQAWKVWSFFPEVKVCWVACAVGIWMEKADTRSGGWGLRVDQKRHSAWHHVSLSFENGGWRYPQNMWKIPNWQLELKAGVMTITPGRVHCVVWLGRATWALLAAGASSCLCDKLLDFLWPGEALKHHQLD